MKTFSYWLCAVLALAVLAFAGCGKKEVANVDMPEIEGVKVNIPGLQKAFETAGGDVQQQVSAVIQGIRYRTYERSLEALDSLANNATVTPDQKKIVTEVLEAMKQVVAKAPSTGGQ
jgi:hypothetical protein